MSGKRNLVDLDPDYEDVSEQQTKRRKVMEEDAKEATKRKIESIIKKQFDVEIENKETELLEISEKLELARTVMDRLRACIVASFYGNANQQKSMKKFSERTPMIHPTVRNFIGKAPPGAENMGYKTETPSASYPNPMVLESEKIGNLVAEVKTPQPFKHYLTDNTVMENEMTGSRQGRFKVKKRIIVGNLSKSIPADQRDDNDQATHKWMVYVRGSKDSPNIAGFVKKVWFFLHPSYRPNDLVEVSQPPFHLTRRGWGEFPVRVQIHFKDSRNKRVDIIHNLKLDRTYTGLQTLGAETVVDIELERDKIEVKQEKKHKEEKRFAALTNIEIKQEPIECNSPDSSQIPCQTFPLRRDIKVEPVDHDYGRSVHANSVATINLHHCVKNELESQVGSQVDLSEQGRSVSSGVQTIRSTSTTLSAPIMTSLPQMHNHLTVISESSPSTQIIPNSGSILLTSPSSNMVIKSVGPVAGPANKTVNLKLLDSGESGISTQTKVNVNFSQTGLQLNRPQIGNQTRLPINQTTNTGLVFLKCTDSQGKTFLIPQQINTTHTSPTKGINSVGNMKQTINNRPILLTSAVQGSNITNLALPGNNDLIQDKQISQTIVRSPKSATSPNCLQKSQLSNGPVFFIKPENVNRAPLTVKTSNCMSAATSTTAEKATSNIQILSKCGQKQNFDSVGMKPINPTLTPQGIGGQSINKSQLKVTPQGLIHVQGQTSSPIIGISPNTVERCVQNSVRPKQPIVLIPSNGKVTLLPGKGKSLLNSVIKSQVPTQSGNNFILLNQTVSPVGNGNVVCVTPSNVISQKKTLSKMNKSDMFVLQTKQPQSGGSTPNHVVIIPVSSEQNSSLVTSNLSNTHTPVTIATTQNKVLGNALQTSTSSDKIGNDKTVLIVVQNDKTGAQNHSNNDTLKVSQKSSTSMLTSLPSVNINNTPKLSSDPQLQHVMVSSSDSTLKQVLLVNDSEGRGQSQSNYNIEDRKCIMDPKKKRQKSVHFKDFIQPICVKDHPDLLSLIRAAVSRHPLVSENAGRSLHPYCGPTHTDWLSWNVGKRRASEWQRASCVRKFIQQSIGGSTSYKGELLWTTKQIVVWCRLHAYSPHYLEKPLHPKGIDLQAETSLLSDKHRKKFTSLIGVKQIHEDLATMDTTTTSDLVEEEVDIMFDSPVNIRTTIQENSKDNPTVDVSECLPITEGCLYVEEMANQIGVKLQQTEVDPGYLCTLVQGMLYKSMENFMSDILRETFALQVNVERYPDTLSVADVYEALKSLSVTDFLTNKYFGVEENVSLSTAPT